ncbi:MAG: RsmD family RNA methyltransferase [Phycisphaeraceae bacterium]
MKIIAGEFRGRTILGPRDQSTTRPITGRVRTSLFDRLTHRGLLDDQPVLDIFAGTGTLGIESLSRGASACLFVEKDRDALRRLERNIHTLDLAARTEILRLDALRVHWIHQLPRPFSEGVSVAFVDPPYALLREAGGWDRLIPLLSALATVALPEGVMVLRTEKSLDVAPIEGWGEPETHTFGSQKLHLYAKRA